MTKQPIYVPILKGKEGEFAALEALYLDLKPRIIPLIEIPDPPYDYVNERPAKNLPDYVAGIAPRLKKCWPELPLYLHLPWLEDQENLDGREDALEAVLTDCTNLGVDAIPVVSLKTSDDGLAVANTHSASRSHSACIRLVNEDFAEEVDLASAVDRLIQGLGKEVNLIDLVIDLKDMDHEASRAVLVARSFFSMIPRLNSWRRVILAAASFPQDLSEVGPATAPILPRREWALWKTLQRRPDRLLRSDLIFGDYAIAHPIPKELDPRTMQMSASIRYTVSEGWLVLKGRNVRQYGFDQYFQLCETLVGRPEYRGREFSWGDGYIDDCALGIKGPGNATTWRKVGTNHHITQVVGDLASLPPGA